MNPIDDLRIICATMVAQMAAQHVALLTQATGLSGEPRRVVMEVVTEMEKALAAYYQDTEANTDGPAKSMETLTELMLNAAKKIEQLRNFERN
jgi:hypothetical protein